MSKAIAAFTGVAYGRSTANDRNNQHFREYVYQDGTHERYYGGSRSWRNNNPGNVMIGPRAKQHGAIGNDGKFAIFPDYETGRAAMKAVLQKESWKNLTIAEMIAGKKIANGKRIPGYAPATENNVPDYLSGIKNHAGLKLNRKMKTLSDGELEKLMNAIEKIEVFRKGEKVKVKAFTKSHAERNSADPATNAEHPEIVAKTVHQRIATAQKNTLSADQENRKTAELAVG